MEQKFGLTEKDKPALITILKRLCLFSDRPESLEKNFSEKRFLEYKIELWAIKELYLSPYKAGLNTNILTYEKVSMKYLKTRKYIGSKDRYSIVEFIKYFITCLQEVLENC